VPIVASIACGSGTPETAPTTTAPPPVVPAGPPKPLDGATVTVTATGFKLDAASAAFKLSDLHVYQGARLTFVNVDSTPHDVLSDPPHIHTDCPEINAAGYLVPGQSRATDPLMRIMTCGFHDHTHEGEEAFSGKVTVEAGEDRGGMRRVRSALRLAVDGWLAIQLAGLVAAPTVLCAHAESAISDHPAACCPGVAPGQMCPMHRAREGSSKCAMTAACHPSDAALVSLFATIGVTPPAPLTLDLAKSFEAVLFGLQAPIARAELPDSPPPRA